MPDEIDINVGDFICASDVALEISEDHWVEGLNISNGRIGVFPLNHVERVTESKSWAWHRSLVVHSTVEVQKRFDRDDGEDPEPAYYAPRKEIWSSDDEAGRTSDAVKQLVIWNPKVATAIDDVVSKTSFVKHQKLHIVRHGERIDFAFPKWWSHCFPDGVYKQIDLNLPKELPLRPCGYIPLIQSHRHDPPLTNMGVEQARLTGRSLRDREIQIDVVYSSPACRSLQTARAILEGMGLQNKVKIRVEPCLFEWRNWYAAIPTFMTPQQLVDNGFNIDPYYSPILPQDKLALTLLSKESIDEFYKRNHRLTDYINKSVEQDCLIVGHAANLETNSRLLLGGKPLPMEKIRDITQNIPYCAMLTLEKIPEENRWSMVGSSIYPFTHGRNFHFDWRIFHKYNDWA